MVRNRIIWIDVILMDFDFFVEFFLLSMLHGTLCKLKQEVKPCFLLSPPIIHFSSNITIIVIRGGNKLIAQRCGHKMNGVALDWYIRTGESRTVAFLNKNGIGSCIVMHLLPSNWIYSPYEVINSQFNAFISTVQITMACIVLNTNITHQYQLIHLSQCLSNIVHKIFSLKARCVLFGFVILYTCRLNIWWMISISHWWYTFSGNECMSKLYFVMRSGYKIGRKCLRLVALY